MRTPPTPPATGPVLRWQIASELHVDLGVPGQPHFAPGADVGAVVDETCAGAVAVFHSARGGPAMSRKRPGRRKAERDTGTPTTAEEVLAVPDAPEPNDGSEDQVAFDFFDDILPSGVGVLAETGPEAPRHDRGAAGPGQGWRGIRRADGLVEPVRLLAELALDPLLTPSLRRALRRERPLVVVVAVPSAAWVRPVEEAIELATARQARILAKAVRTRGTAEADLDAQAVERIATGRPLMAITPDIGFLAPVLVAAADHTLIVPPLDAALVAKAIGLWCGRRSRVTVAAADLTGLDLLDIAAALRTGATPAACLDRLRRASRSRTGVEVADTAPPLDGLTGCGDALEWARNTVIDIARVRRGTLAATALEAALLYGPPGTGKTTLARALAAAAGVRFVETSVAAWLTDGPGYLDSVLKQITAFVAELEAAAKRDGTAVGFIDELDALPSRSRLDARHASWWQPVVAHVLTSTERLRRAGVVLLAATNHPEAIDPALLRPGRFDRSFLIGPPDEAGRIGILRAHLGQDLPDVDLVPAARLSSGMTGAVLAGHVRGARGRARAAGRGLVLDDLLAEIAPAETRSAPELRAVALHEAGHALVALRLGLSVEQVSIQAGADYGGRTIVRMATGIPDRFTLERRVVGLLAGRAADARLGAGVTAGAASDLREATRQVAALQACLGLGTSLSVLVEPDHVGLLLRENPTLARQVETELRRLQGVAETMVQSDRAAIAALTEILLVRRVVTGEEVVALAAAHRPRLRVPAGRREQDAPDTGSPAPDPNIDPAAPS